MGEGGGGGEFSARTNFFFAQGLCRNFFSGEPLCTKFFFRPANNAFFWTVKSWFIIYVFVLYKLFYAYNRSKDTGHLKVKSFPKCTHSRGSHLEWTASLCNFLMSLRVKVLTLTTFSSCYRILIQGAKTHPIIFFVGTSNCIEYLQSYQILIFIYYKFYFIIFIIIQYTVYVVGTLAAI